MRTAFSALFCCISAYSLVGCGSDDKEEQPASCNYTEQTGCKDGQVCEQRDGDSQITGCFAPVVVEGKVVRLDDPKVGVEGARVLARDENGASVSDIAVSGADGSYKLKVPAARKEDGTPVLPELLLRADAAGFATFPGGLRVAIPVDVSKPTKDAAAYHVTNASTTVALDELADTSGLGTVSGKVLAKIPSGTLVVAGAATGVSDTDGSYVLFNVPAGDYDVRGYRKGLSLEAAAASVAAGKETKGVDLSASDAALGEVNGTLSFVNASAKTTSVVLVVESTFSEALKRGEVPQGLRAHPVTGPYSFEGVPAGDYVVLAAFENDELVRDPDMAIGGTAIQHISVASAPVDVTGFKITGALGVVSPGADGAEAVSGDISFEWADDSSEDGYEVTVLDTFGEQVWQDLDVPNVSGSSTVTLAYGGDPLAAGYYQFRAVSYRQAKNSATRTYISATEDLKGVFIVE
jgi:hypothetical protein